MAKSIQGNKIILFEFNEKWDEIEREKKQQQ